MLVAMYTPSFHHGRFHAAYLYLVVIHFPPRTLTTYAWYFAALTQRQNGALFKRLLYYEDGLQCQGQQDGGVLASSVLSTAW